MRSWTSFGMLFCCELPLSHHVDDASYSITKRTESRLFITQSISMLLPPCCPWTTISSCVAAILVFSHHPMSHGDTRLPSAHSLVCFFIPCNYFLMIRCSFCFVRLDGFCWLHFEEGDQSWGPWYVLRSVGAAPLTRRNLYCTARRQKLRAISWSALQYHAKLFTKVSKTAHWGMRDESFLESHH